MDCLFNTMTEELKFFFQDRGLVLRHKGTKIGETPPYTFTGHSETDQLETILRRFVAGEDIPPVDYCFKEALDQAQLRVFRRIDAAGGVVFDGDGKVLLIRRFDRWDLPKGKCEKGERPEETAIREVVEECGLSTLPQILHFLTDSWHIYPDKGSLALKKTSWFSMRYYGSKELVPQREEGISQACWRGKETLSEIFTDTYPSLREVFILAGLVNP